VTRIDLLMVRATKSLAAAERLLRDGDPEISAGQIYYACFYVAEALLSTEGLKFSSHSQVLAQYGLRFAKTEKLDRRFHHVLLRSVRVRQTADYQVEIPVNANEIEELMQGAKEFLAAATRYLDEHPMSTESAGRDDG
jgi:uncharacterized protein (UPF0332 family)